MKHLRNLTIIYMSSIISEKNPKPSQQEQVELLQEFLHENYEFRQNLLSGKMEVKCLGNTSNPEQTGSGDFVPLTRNMMNSIALNVRKTGLEITSLKQFLEECIFSDATPVFDPIADYLRALPAWDGHNHVADLCSRIPHLTTEQQYMFSVWMRSAVAHWLGMDTEHGNEVVATFIGSQGCGKSTFCVRLLPKHLRPYYLDHLNMANKFDKEVALTNNLIVNLDELDQIKRGQQAQLKHTLSKNSVNGRVIFSGVQENRRRYASFVATTNNPRPLTDPTGSRRFLCISIPKGKLIDNDTEINYEQLYAQVCHELQVKGMRYWFTNEEVMRLQQMNVDFQQVTDLASMVNQCFRHPEEKELVQPLSSGQVLEKLAEHFPGMTSSAHDATIKLGLVLKKMEFKSSRSKRGQLYEIVPKEVA